MPEQIFPQYGADENDYYGRLLEVVEVEYPGLPIKKMLIFKCEWFDGSSAGTQVHHAYKLVSLNHRRKYAGDDAFVLASQAIQVFYCSYPSLNRSKSDWWAVCKTQARANVQVPASNESTSSNIPPPLQEDDLVDVTTIVIDDPLPNLSHDVFIDIEDDDDEDEDEDEEIAFSDNYSTDDEFH